MLLNCSTGSCKLQSSRLANSILKISKEGSWTPWTPPPYAADGGSDMVGPGHTGWLLISNSSIVHQDVNICNRYYTTCRHWALEYVQCSQGLNLKCCTVRQLFFCYRKITCYAKIGSLGNANQNNYSSAVFMSSSTGVKFQVIPSLVFTYQTCTCYNLFHN